MICGRLGTIRRLEPVSDSDIVIPSNQDPKLTANAVLQKIQGVPLAGLDEYLNTPTVNNAGAIEEFYRRQEASIPCPKTSRPLVH